MKYLGKKSVSSFMSGFLRVAWYIVIVLSIIGAIIMTILLFYVPPENPDSSEFAKAFSQIFKDLKKDEGWNVIRNLPIFVKMLFLPYMAVIMVLLLKIIKKAQNLFSNFKNNIIFNQNNVHIISKIGKLLIIFSIFTFNFSSLFSGILLLILCEIFKNGTALQEEQNLTI